MRILVNFMHRDSWSIRCSAEDARTIMSKWTRVSSEETMLRLVRACGANEDAMAEVAREIKARGRGSVWLEMKEDQKRLLRMT